MYIKLRVRNEHFACGKLEENDCTSYHRTRGNVRSVQLVGFNGQLRRPRSVENDGQTERCTPPGLRPDRNTVQNGCILMAQDGGPGEVSHSQLQFFFRGRVHRELFLLIDLMEKGEVNAAAPFSTVDLFETLWHGRKRLTVETDGDIAGFDYVLQWSAEGDVWFDAGPWGPVDGAHAPAFFREQFSMIDTIIETMHMLERNLQRSLDRQYSVSEGLQRAARAFWEHTLLCRFLTELGYHDPHRR